MGDLTAFFQSCRLQAVMAKGDMENGIFVPQFAVTFGVILRHFPSLLLASYLVSLTAGSRPDLELGHFFRQYARGRGGI